MNVALTATHQQCLPHEQGPREQLHALDSKTEQRRAG